jgi:hypothetical protein
MGLVRGKAMGDITTGVISRSDCGPIATWGRPDTIFMQFFKAFTR